MWMLFLLVLGLAGAGRAAMVTPASAEICGRCHAAIHDAWKASVHARAMEDRLFQDSLDLAVQDFGGGIRKVCLSCHAPVAVRIGDLALDRKVSWEGVTCDYCHSIQNVSLAGLNPRAKVEFTLTKRGPLKDVDSNVHGTAYSAVFTSALACVSCHEYKTAAGFPVLATYTEWKNSRAAREGQDCQSCHMYQVAGAVVDPRVRRTKEAEINLHLMPGGHSIDQLNKAIGAKLAVSHEGGQLRVSVEVTNRGAGHSAPTGSALRQIILDVTADAYNGQHYRGERIYRRVVADAQGKEIDREHAAWVKSAKVLSDTRLAPDEKRTEAFTFPVPEGVESQVKAAFWYYYSPMARTEAQKRVTFLTLQRLVR